MRVLFLAAEPSDTVRLRLGEEQRAIREALQRSRGRDEIEFHERFAVRPADLTQALHDVRPQVVHVSGHGAQTGELCFEDDAGRSQPVAPDALGRLFALVADDVEAVILNACYSVPQAASIAGSIPCVIGMSNALPDGASIRFSTGFYKALGAGHGYAEAFRFGEAEMHLHGVPAGVGAHLLAWRRSHFRSAARPDPAYATFGLDRDRIHVDPSAFDSLRDLVEMFFRAYLVDRVPPLTYGRDWIIEGGSDRHLLLAPAAWVRQPSEPARRADPAWADELGLDAAGITPGSRWRLRVRDGHDELVSNPYAVATTDPDVVRLLRNSMKAFHYLGERLVETAAPPTGPVVVVESWPGAHHGGRWYIDPGGELPEDARWALRS